MLELVPALMRWHRTARRFAVATVVAVTGSAPRPVGSALAVDEKGEVIGNVSGGCVEGAVYNLCREALTTGKQSVHRFGWSDDSAFAVGLTCGGKIEVFIQPDPEFPSPDETVLFARVFRGPDDWAGRSLIAHDGVTTQTLGDPTLDNIVLACQNTEVIHWRDRFTDELVEVLVEVVAPAPRMLIFGALDFAVALSEIGGFLGYKVTVCDAREVFATRSRFPSAEVVVDWPHRYLDHTKIDERTVVCVLTHDPKFDVPLLTRALRMPVAYVGAMGSRRTHAERLLLLREAGSTEEELGRLHSPLGLDLGARTPAETALSIAAEITACRSSASGRPLTELSGAIHARPGREQERR